MDFWFREAVDPDDSIEEWNKVWFGDDEKFDQAIRSRFASLPDLALSGQLNSWLDHAGGALALVLVLDQFPRNIYRGSAQCFAYDGKAQEVADLAVERAYDQALRPIEAVFLYMPFEHAEDIDKQRSCVSLVRKLVERAPQGQKEDFENYVSYAVRHHDIIERSGRFPHRNEILGRAMTDEERDYLDSGGDAF